MGKSPTNLQRASHRQRAAVAGSEPTDRSAPADSPGGPIEAAVQAGVVPYRLRADGMVQIMLVTSRSGPWWIVPKGNVDPGHTPREAAAREAYEEAGLLGTTGRRQIGSYIYPKLGNSRRVALFAMRVDRVLRRWPEMGERKREWVSVDEAIRRVPYSTLKDVLERLEAFEPAAVSA